MADDPARPAGDAEDDDAPTEATSQPQPRIHRRFSIHEVVAKTGVPHRTIHYFVSRGIIAPPLGYGRGATYTDDHLHDIAEIARWNTEHRAWNAAVRAEAQRANREDREPTFPPQPRPIELRTRGRDS